MVESIEWLRLLISEYKSFEYLIVFFATVFGGEVVLFFIGFLIAQNFLPVFPTAVLIFFGAFIPNILWFLLGKTNLANKTASSKYANKTFLIITETIIRVSKGNHLLALIIIKFLVGTPILLVIYANKISLSFRKFMYYQSIAIFVSAFVIVFIGYTGGRGFEYFSEISENLYTTIGFILFFIFIIVLGQVWFEKMFIGDDTKS